MSIKGKLRIGAIVVSLLMVLLIGVDLATSSDQGVNGTEVELVEASGTYTPDGLTVITTTNFKWESLGEDGQIVVVAPNGSVVYRNTTYEIYDDVDPSPAGETTVEYMAARHLNDSVCETTERCSRNVLERANLTTGETEVLFSRITPRIKDTRWHDADRIDEHHYVVADLAQNRLFVANVTSDEIVWEWHAREAFDRDSGGDYEEDWTHLNDVEVLPDGRFMASPRNHDQVIFVDREQGLVENWTLGADERHEILYEQHNPDFIPRDRGGPAVLVADSHNNRIIEYQRVDGEWEARWAWYDEQLLWPRDADRLPNGHTLVTDTNGNRVVEVDADGDVVWGVAVNTPYEAERLDTGDESAGGQSADAANLQSDEIVTRDDVDDSDGGLMKSIESRIEAVLPAKIVSGVAYVSPPWLSLLNVVELVLLVGTLTVWVVSELVLNRRETIGRRLRTK